MSAAAIRLSPSDNVVVCCRTVEPGERFEVDGHALEIAERHVAAVMTLGEAMGG